MRTLTLTDAQAHILAALLNHHAETTAPEDTMAMLSEVMPDEGGHDFESRVNEWAGLCEAVAAARPRVAGA